MLNNIPTLSTTKAIAFIRDAFNITGLGFDGSFTGLPVIMYGQAGCGKTYAPRSIAEADGYQFREISAMHHSPTDALGARTIPLDGSDHIKHYYPDWAKGLDVLKPAIIVIDEITKAQRAVMAAWLGALNERRAGAFEFGREWRFVLTGNVTSARSGDVELLGATRTRCAQLLVSNTAEQWLNDYAIPHNLHPYVTSFVKLNDNSPDFPNGVLNTWDSETNPAAFANERAWTHLSHACYAVSDPKQFGFAIVGNEVGTSFALHIDLVDNIPDQETILASPDSAPVPTDLAICYYAGAVVAHWAEPQYMDSIAAYLRRMPAETATTSMAEVVHRHPECKETRAYIQFRTDYKLSL